MNTKYTDVQKSKIKKTLSRLGKCLMKDGSHGYNDYKGMSILDASEQQVKKWKQPKNAAIAVLGIILGANRNWERAVQRNLDKIKSGEYKEMTFDTLQELIRKHDYDQFATIWGHRDEKKYDTLSNLVSAILKLKERSQSSSDYELMSKWAKQADLNDRKNDSIGKIKNIGIATFQHLRLTFGIDTVKPDQRVMEVLNNEFEYLKETPNSSSKLTPLNAIRMVEKIAEISGKPVALVDQIFVKYGSGYPTKTQTL